MEDIAKLEEQFLKARLHLPRDHRETIKQVVKALDVLFSWGRIFVRLAIRALLLLGDPALPYTGDEEGRDDLDLLPVAHQGSRYKVKEPLSWFEDVRVPGSVVEELGLGKRFEAWCRELAKGEGYGETSARAKLRERAPLLL